MKKILDFINRFILILSNSLRKLNKFIKIRHQKNVITVNSFIKKHKTIKDTFDPLIKEKSLENAELLSTLNHLQKIDNNLSNELKDFKFKNKYICKKIQILSDLIINK
ncbi:hypothetical protein K144313037_03710 [Clostridium tetani]|uniref:hypothetical protein n=1 Tax=Clostridium tetani TaxID=1513 RepID=UPI0002F2D7C8|nr:hypothetical protein [Clostridium tetani]KGI38097.1 hypothetical protein LA33_10060 [Clostridium tetani ATCC 9441]KGI40881.1 hypothetical protein KY52_02130 [Clostridium tetani]KGI41949.1 hypothetical protein KY55_11400 [Clostridium tetani]KGI43753.1 hypothetical protein KY54_09295 [Clostridium tetani]KHO37870.1 hypothetical protein OR63_02550 [Clostridium tetani]